MCEALVLYVVPLNIAIISINGGQSYCNYWKVYKFLISSHYMINDLTSFFEGKKEKVLNFLAHLKATSLSVLAHRFSATDYLLHHIGFFKTQVSNISVHS